MPQKSEWRKILLDSIKWQRLPVSLGLLRISLSSTQPKLRPLGPQLLKILKNFKIQLLRQFDLRHFMLKYLLQSTKTFWRGICPG